MKPWVMLAIGAVLSNCAAAPEQTPALPKPMALPQGAHYVAMGSSFAAGPSVMPQVEGGDKRCSRSHNNYAQHLARARKLTLTDVSCSGAKTDHLLGPWNELPAQLDALRPETRLVTITIGGNDVGFVGSLMKQSCVGAAKGTAPPPVAEKCEAMKSYAARAAAQGTPTGLPQTTEADWAKLEQNFHRLNAEIRRRAPNARIIYVDYLTMIPDDDLCMAVPLQAEDAAMARRTAQRLADTTRRTALADGAEVLRASDLSRDHHVCSAQPWSVGLLAPPDAPTAAPYHPNAAGMAAIGEALIHIVQ